MAHSPQHLAAAGLIADSFAPGSQGVPPASRMGVPEIMLDIAQRNPRRSERSQLEMLLRLWDGRALGTLNRGRPQRFSALTPAQRERLLLSLANSRVPQKRALFNSLRFGLMVTAALSAQAPDFSPGLADPRASCDELSVAPDTVDSSSAIAKPETPAEPAPSAETSHQPEDIGGSDVSVSPTVSRVNQPGPQAALRPGISGLQSGEDVNYYMAPGPTGHSPAWVAERW